MGTERSKMKWLAVALLLCGIAEANPPTWEAVTPMTRGASRIPPGGGVEQEPNDSFGTSNPLTPGSSVRGRIQPKGDGDWYRFNVPHQGEVRIVASDVAPNLKVVYRAWNADKKALTDWYTPLRLGGDTVGSFNAPAAGDYLLEVRDANDDSASDQEYGLALEFTASADQMEPNGTFGTATEIVPGQNWQATILPQGDVDWYRLEVDHQGEMSLLVTEVPENLDVSVRVWDRYHQALSDWFTPSKPGGDTTVVVDLPTPGAHFLEVRDGGNDAASVRAFRLRVAFRPSPDDFEPNNDYGNTRPLALDATAKATILPKGDSDWYELKVEEQGTLEVKVTEVPATLDVCVRLWNGEKQPFTEWFKPIGPGSDTTANIDIKSGGRYKLEVRDGGDDERSLDPYSLQLSFTPTKDRGEPNDSFGTATPLVPGAPLSATILPRGDADWYRIFAPRAGDLRIEISDVPTDLELSARLWSAEKTAISDRFTSRQNGGTISGTITLASPGDYFLEVRGGRKDARSAAPYRVSVSL